MTTDLTTDSLPLIHFIPQLDHSLIRAEMNCTLKSAGDTLLCNNCNFKSSIWVTDYFSVQLSNKTAIKIKNKHLLKCI